MTMKPTSFHLLALLLLSGLLITGCELLLGDDPSLTDTRWHLEAIENTSGEVILDPDPDHTYRFRFHSDSTVTARNACNDCGGWYETRGEELTIAVLCNEAACGTPVPYLGYGVALNRTTSYAIMGDELRLRSTDRHGNEQILVHRPD